MELHTTFFLHQLAVFWLDPLLEITVLQFPIQLSYHQWVLHVTILTTSGLKCPTP